MTLDTLSLDIATLQSGYRSGAFTPGQVFAEVLRRVRTAPERHVWITRLPEETVLAAAARLDGMDPLALPLHGIPFAIKDNIDLAGTLTTAACPAFAYTPTTSATVVARLMAAGAIPIGKTNLDQFATGLVGTRSPYGACRNSVDPDYISGGSSSGSAVAVASGLASFALGTDTAGSGRVPAAFNNLLGYKPTCGWLSPRGMVPACRTLDTVSVFALCAADAADVARQARGFDAPEPGSRRPPGVRRMPVRPSTQWRVGVPRAAQLEFFGSADYAAAHAKAMERLQHAGLDCVEVDFEPFLAVARLLYEGPWLAERALAVRPLMERDPAALWPVTREICRQGERFSAMDAFAAQYRLSELRRECERAWEQVDVLLTPTAGTIHRLADEQAEPLALNAQLGRYTNFVNLLDLAAVAFPAGFTSRGLPYGLTVIGPAWSDDALLAAADAWHRALVDSAGALGQPLPAARPWPGEEVTDEQIDLAVCGAHLQGLPLNGQLTERGATLRAVTRTSRQYRLFALPGGPPFRPGLVRSPDRGTAVDVEVWSVPASALGSFVAGIPAPLGVGKVELEDGRWVSGFICEGHAVAAAEDISHFGGWRAYLAGTAIRR
jgi:allophanate hydrolase